MYRVRQSSKLENATTRKVLRQVKDIIEDCYSNFGCMECYFDEYGTLVALIHGGLNGDGKWSHYLGDLSNLLRSLIEHFSEAWVINIDVDVLDDVFYVYVGLDKSRI